MFIGWLTLQTLSSILEKHKNSISRIKWIQPLLCGHLSKKEHSKTDNGGTVNINNMGSYIVRKYVNEINYAYTYTQKYTSTKLKSPSGL